MLSASSFLEAVTKTHGENKYGREYAATIAYVRSLIEARKKKTVTA